jgi:hypothetical protein
MAGSAKAEYGPLAVYQVAISQNCNNPDFCGSELGGFWGWAVFNSDGTADAELTFCGHLEGGPGGAGGGAGHESIDATGWFIAPSSEDPSIDTFWISHEVVRSGGVCAVGAADVRVAQPEATLRPARGADPEVRVLSNNHDFVVGTLAECSAQPCLSDVPAVDGIAHGRSVVPQNEVLAYFQPVPPIWPQGARFCAGNTAVVKGE